jgi:7-cyano-7-deazaguanine tRNA-ribosyltransferase
LLVVAGLSLKNLQPRVWDPNSPFHLPNLRAVMVSYADFHRMPAKKCAAMEQGLRTYLGVPKELKIYLDNGAFYFLTRGGETPVEAYEEFVKQALPDWYPIPRDYIPTPVMTDEEQKSCFDRTMQANLSYEHDGYVPVVHIGRFLDEYVVRIRTNAKLSQKQDIALGGIVPNLLRAPKAVPYQVVLDALVHVRRTFADKEVHVFGIGGTATLHLAALLGVDSVDSSGWRNRAARGIVQLPGSGDRMVAELGSWSGRRPNPQEQEILRSCSCPACERFGLDGLVASHIEGFCNRATHNLWVLLEETRWIRERLESDTYTRQYKDRLNNSIYSRLVDRVVEASVQTRDEKWIERRKSRVPSQTKSSRKIEI